MFNETSYNTFGDAAGGTTPLWSQLGYPSKAAWKQAGSPSGSTFTPPPGLPLGNSSGLPVGVSPLWERLGFDVKGTWKRAGRPTSAGGGGTITGGSDDPTLIDGGSGVDPVTGAPMVATGGGIGDMLASIPPMYLMIGAAIILLMVMKK